LRKSKAVIDKATTDYVEGIKELIPGSTMEVSNDAYGGFDVLVRIFAPGSLLDDESEIEIREAKAGLSIRISDETGVNIMSTLEEQTPAVQGRDEGNKKR
jgi:hypothetical protein